MNISEFKAFIEGIKHSFYRNSPNAEQWAAIEQKIEKLTDTQAAPIINAPSSIPSAVPYLYPYATSTADAVRRTPDDRG